MGLFLIACSSKSPDNRPQPTPSPQAGSASPARPIPADDWFTPDSLGALTFEVSQGTPEARGHFTRGLLALHSFWYDEARRQFEAAIAADPKMNMAYWGLSMSYCKLLWRDDDIAAARA